MVESEALFIELRRAFAITPATDSVRLFVFAVPDSHRVEITVDGPRRKAQRDGPQASPQNEFFT